VDSSTLTTVITGADGTVTISDLEPGVYQVKEKKVPDGYLLDETPQLITLVQNETGIVRFYNYPKSSLLIRKVDSVTGDPLQNDCWVEDGAIAAISMQYQAEELGLGTCWIQMRGRGLSDGTAADDVIRGVLGLPDNYNVLCIIAVGQKADERKPQNEDKLKFTARGLLYPWT